MNPELYTFTATTNFVFVPIGCKPHLCGLPGNGSQAFVSAGQDITDVVRSGQMTIEEVCHHINIGNVVGAPV